RAVGGAAVRRGDVGLSEAGPGERRAETSRAVVRSSVPEDRRRQLQSVAGVCGNRAGSDEHDGIHRTRGDSRARSREDADGNRDQEPRRGFSHRTLLPRGEHSLGLDARESRNGRETYRRAVRGMWKSRESGRGFLPVFLFRSNLPRLPIWLTAPIYKSRAKRREDDTDMKHGLIRFTTACAAAAGMMVAAELRAQVTVAAGYTPPDDTPKINVGVTIFANYSYQHEPTVKDNSPQQNVIPQSSFDVTRAYINVTGSLSHWFSFRITPDIARETGTGSSLAGSQTFRLKYAYGQVNFDDFMPRGTWLRIGAQQTPYIDFYEGVYRYRFQGTIFVDREGFLTSSDYAVSSRVAFPDNYGDIHLGYYNGDGYSSTNDQRGLNNQKAFQVRGTLRPLPGLAIWRGIRLTGFYDTDHYYPDAKRERFVGAFTFEHPWVNAGFEWLDAHDRTTVT